jgi:hypothetical protein
MSFSQREIFLMKLCSAWPAMPLTLSLLIERSRTSSVPSSIR